MTEATPNQVERVGWYLRHISRCLDRDMAFLLSREGLTFAQMLVLRQIKASQCTTLAELTDQLKWAASTLSGIIKRLERDGLVERLPDPSDLRVYRLCITPKAHQVLEVTCKAYNEHLAGILSHFQGEELTALITGLEGLWRAVRKEQPQRLD
ncbi:MAG TPA: MarR family transcriptional regulator [bacterium]|jgi:DNA-binding MarR family transcriptional regulator|nr:MarR family transcriptional regulator [bacterium]